MVSVRRSSEARHDLREDDVELRGICGGALTIPGAVALTDADRALLV